MTTIRTTIRMTLLLAGALSAGVPAAAQDAAPVLDPQTGLVQSISELVVDPGDFEGGWLELTALRSDTPASLTRLGDRAPGDGELRLRPRVPPGAAMLCTVPPEDGKWNGAAGAGVLCEQVYLQGEAWVEPGETLDVEVRFESGLAVRGRYLLDGWPISGARVAVVPADLEADRPFTMPLILDSAGTRTPTVLREVPSDADGRFILPRLAQGEYFLETLLPSGRVHRGEPFALPVPAAVRRRTGAGEGQTVWWDLGEIDVAAGLVVEFQVTDPQGMPLARAQVAGRQGRTPDSLIDYQTVTDGDGVAGLSGFSVEQGVHLSCRKQGYRTFEQDYPLLPVLVSCTLEPLAAVRGEVLGIDGLPPAGAMVSVEAVSVAPVPAPAEIPPAVAIDAGGGFKLGDLAAGEYLLKAAAPGFEIENRTIVLEPGQRLELEAIVLLYGRALEGRVVDAETRKPIAGVEIHAVSPPGAVFGVSGEEGAFKLVTGTRETLVLRLTAEGYAGREVTLTPKRPAERVPLLFEMERGGRIRALVWDTAADLPCQSCRLVIRPSAAELITGAGGEALSETLAAGWYRVYRPRISHLGSTVITQDDAEYRHVEVRRGETSTVRFGERRRTVRIVFRPSPGADWSLSARAPSRSERYHQEPGGGFLVRHRSGESLDLFLQRYDPLAGAEIEVWQTTLPADLPAAELVLPLAGARLLGKATSDGAPLAGVPVRLRTLEYAPRATARTRPDGTFAITHLPAGVYTVFIGERNVGFASLRSGQSLDLGKFELISGSF